MRICGKDTLFNDYGLLKQSDRTEKKHCLCLLPIAYCLFPVAFCLILPANPRNKIHRVHIPQRDHIDPAAFDAIDAAFFHGVQ